MKILVIDGQGGRIGRGMIELLKKGGFRGDIIAVGTNSSATEAMMKAGADRGATGDNPVAVNAAEADIITGPVGIIAANSLMGEVTPRMAYSVAASRAKKVLIPMNRCNIVMAGTEELSLNEYIARAAQLILAEEKGEKGEKGDCV
ncbi:MAG: DUF3842 family protein [Clostridia bacterium]|nr:DUF3842 family protein [Clostridia bacterium]